jgi:Helix-turn-helix domain
MSKIPYLSLAARKQLIRAARKTGDRVLIFRTTILAALAVGGRSQRVVADLLGCAASTVSETKSRFRTEGFDGLRDRRVDNGIDKVDADYLEALRVLLCRDSRSLRVASHEGVSGVPERKGYRSGTREPGTQPTTDEETRLSRWSRRYGEGSSRRRRGRCGRRRGGARELQRGWPCGS